MGYDKVVNEHLGAVQHPTIAIHGCLKLHGIWNQPGIALVDSVGEHHTTVRYRRQDFLFL